MKINTQTFKSTTPDFKPLFSIVKSNFKLFKPANKPSTKYTAHAKNKKITNVFHNT